MHPPRVTPCHSNVEPLDQKGRLNAPSAARNAAAILAVLAQYVPQTGTALEIASGTGQHAVAFAQQHPAVQWQPTEMVEERLTSIRLWQEATPCPNLHPPLAFDAVMNPYPLTDLDVVIAVNLLHLISEEDCWTILTKTAKALAPGGLLFLYGPFRRPDGFASTADRDFHHHLQSFDASIGYKEVRDMRNWITSRGLLIEAVQDMPANNLMWVIRKPI